MQGRHRDTHDGLKINSVELFTFPPADLYIRYAHGRVCDYDYQGRFFGCAVGWVDLGLLQRNCSRACSTAGRIIVMNTQLESLPIGVTLSALLLSSSLAQTADGIKVRGGTLSADEQRKRGCTSIPVFG